MREKRKNGARRFQWGLLVIGFAHGVLLMLIIMPKSAATPMSQALALPDEALWLTATGIVQDATASALGTPMQDAARDPFLASATAMIVQATQTAQAGR